MRWKNLFLFISTGDTASMPDANAARSQTHDLEANFPTTDPTVWHRSCA